MEVRPPWVLDVFRGCDRVRNYVRSYVRSTAIDVPGSAAAARGLFAANVGSRRSPRPSLFGRVMPRTVALTRDESVKEAT